MKFFMRHREKGTIYNWAGDDQVFIDNPHLEKVTEEMAFPERFVPKHSAARVERKRGRQPKAALDLETILEEDDHTPPALAEEAAKGLPK